MKQSGLNISHVWHHAQPVRNASQFQISMPTLLGCLPMPLGPRPAVPTSRGHYPPFRPQSQDTIHTYYTRIESPGLRNDTLNGNTTSGSQPMPYAWHAPSPDRLPKTTPWFRLGETIISKGGARHRNFHTSVTHCLYRTTVWFSGLDALFRPRLHEMLALTAVCRMEPVASVSHSLALVEFGSQGLHTKGVEYGHCTVRARACEAVGAGATSETSKQ